MPTFEPILGTPELFLCDPAAQDQYELLKTSGDRRREERALRLGYKRRGGVCLKENKGRRGGESLLLTSVASMRSTKLVASFRQKHAGRLGAGKEAVSNIPSVPG